MASSSPVLRNATAHDVDPVLHLNQAVVDVTSPMNAKQYQSIAQEASLDLVAELNDRVIGFLLALRKGANYDNGNFKWFSHRYANFLYVDRVVVDDQTQGMGIGRLFYSHLMEWARRRQLQFIAAEISIVPPNPGSQKFHEKLGFEEVGTRDLGDGKIVSMMLKRL